MSALTKVFVLLVSLLAIFLCGVVVTFVASVENYKTAYENEVMIRQAAQVQAVAAEQNRDRTLQRDKALIVSLNETVLEHQKRLSGLSRELAVLQQGRDEAIGRANTAVNTMQALQQTIQNMYTGQNTVQTELNKAHQEMIAARAQVIDLTRELNGEQVKSQQLESIRRQNEEKVVQLEDENSDLRRKLQQVTVASSDLRKGMDKVSLALPAGSGVPIRGQVTAVDGSLASISVGSSSGVRRNMTFHVARGTQYLGELVVTDIEPTEAAGRLTRVQGAIVTGDRVSTGFD